MGNRARVLDRWYGSYGRSSWRAAKKPRAAFAGEAQYKFEDLFISPLTHKRSVDADGNIIYVPIEPPRNLTPTGIKVMDSYLQHLARGEADVTEFCKQYNARTSDIDGMVFLLSITMRAICTKPTADLTIDSHCSNNLSNYVSVDPTTQDFSICSLLEGTQINTFGKLSLLAQHRFVHIINSQGVDRHHIIVGIELSDHLCDKLVEVSVFPDCPIPHSQYKMRSLCRCHWSPVF